MGKLKDIQEVLGANVRRLRANYTQDEYRSVNKLARKLKIGNNAISSIEADEGNPQLETLVCLAEFWGLEPWHLLVRGVTPDNKPQLLSQESRAKIASQIQEAAHLLGGGPSAAVADEVLTYARPTTADGKRRAHQFRKNRGKKLPPAK